jgi:hypothetical protein
LNTRLTLLSVSSLALSNALAQESDSGTEFHGDAVECLTFEPYESVGPVRFDPRWIGESLSMEELVTELLELDIAGKQAVLDYQFPSDWNEESAGAKYAHRLSDYLNSSSFAEAAKCLVLKYQEGDDIRRWSIESQDLQEEGFVLMRDGEIAVKLITAQIWD